jgi:hypothetical protein
MRPVVQRNRPRWLVWEETQRPRCARACLSVSFVSNLGWNDVDCDDAVESRDSMIFINAAGMSRRQVL